MSSRSDDLVVVRTFGDRITAEVARSALDAAGIQALVRSDDAGATKPGMWPGRGVELIVRSADLERANEVLTTSPRQP